MKGIRNDEIQYVLLHLLRGAKLTIFVEKHGIALGLAQLLLLLSLGVVFLEGRYVLDHGRVAVAQHHEGKEEDQGPTDRVLLP